MNQFQLVSSIDHDDVVFEAISNQETSFLRMGDSVVGLSGNLLEISWEHAIQHVTPIGYHKIFLFEETVIYLSVDQGNCYKNCPVMSCQKEW